MTAQGTGTALVLLPSQCWYKSHYMAPGGPKAPTLQCLYHDLSLGLALGDCSAQTAASQTSSPASCSAKAGRSRHMESGGPLCQCGWDPFIRQKATILYCSSFLRKFSGFLWAWHQGLSGRIHPGELCTPVPVLRGRQTPLASTAAAKNHCKQQNPHRWEPRT